MNNGFFFFYYYYNIRSSPYLYFSVLLFSVRIDAVQDKGTRMCRPSLRQVDDRETVLPYLPAAATGVAEPLLCNNLYAPKETPPVMTLPINRKPYYYYTILLKRFFNRFRIHIYTIRGMYRSL